MEIDSRAVHVILLARKLENTPNFNLEFTKMSLERETRVQVGRAKKITKLPFGSLRDEPMSAVGVCVFERHIDHVGLDHDSTVARG
jgi:hypothetical protein